MFNLELKDGQIKGLIHNAVNLAEPEGNTGSVGFTFVCDDIKNQPLKEEFNLYSDRSSEYDYVKIEENVIICTDSKNNIETEYHINDNALIIKSHTENEQISQFALNFDLNFLGKKTDYKTQLMPTSPYKSMCGRYFYYMLTRLDGKVMTIVSRKLCDGWKIRYSPYMAGHYIQRLQIMASFDKVFNGSGIKELDLEIFISDSVDKAFERISEIFNAPLLKIVKSGGFDGTAEVEVIGKCDKIKLVGPDNTEAVCEVKQDINRLILSKFGLYTAIPYCGNIQGLDAVLWYGEDEKTLFDKATDAIKKPYHCDDNLCEGGCFLWSILCNMRSRNHKKYDALARYELSEVMGEKGIRIPRKTIVPERTEYAPYHICKSKRVQEQFFGVSILLEAYKTYKEQRYLEFAQNALDELLDNYFIDGQIYNGEDYTTVCAPVIAVVDMANEVQDAERKERYKKAAIAVAEYLVKRGISFPTEGTDSNSIEQDFEDGSISCTALSVLYVCANLHYDEEYIRFARGILDLHKAWTIYTPDARMYGSSFRWWETIWEADGEGPAICAGHAWTIWKAEALYWYGVLTKDNEALQMSWNGFVTNLAKTQANGDMYSCFEVDYIRGGGEKSIKDGLYQLADQSYVDSYKVAHSYPEHTDSSLSRYAWVRYQYTWGKGNENKS